MTNAQVYWMDWWRRHMSSAPQRGQYPGSAALAGRDSKPHVSQEMSPARAALNAVVLIMLPLRPHPIGRRWRRTPVRPLDPLPDFVRIESRHDRGKEQYECANRIHTGASLHRRQFRNLDQRNQDAEQ